MQLQIQDVTHTYANGFVALQNVSLTLGPGLFGLLGENGAGKSSLMRIIATLQHPRQGTILFNGENVLEHPDWFRRMLGYLPQEFGVYPSATAEQMLTQLADLKGIDDRAERRERVETMLHRVNLWGARRQALGSFSGGMRQRFGIAQALIANPAVVIVDEPTTGLDPAERNRLYDLLAETGDTAIVLLSTHLVEDINTLCSHLAIMGYGQVLATGTPARLVASLAGRLWEQAIPRSDLPRYQEQHPVIAHRYLGGQLYVTLLAEAPPARSVAKTPTLEDAYFAIISPAHSPR